MNRCMTSCVPAVLVCFNLSELFDPHWFPHLKRLKTASVEAFRSPVPENPV